MSDTFIFAIKVSITWTNYLIVFCRDDVEKIARDLQQTFILGSIPKQSSHQSEITTDIKQLQLNISRNLSRINVLKNDDG